MRIIGSSYHRGTSTILGTIIFIGIMFTAVIPMMLVMRQADTLHDTVKHEVEVLDDERSREILGFYAYPESQTSENVKVKIINNGEVLSHVVKIWINGEPEDADINIPTMSGKEQVIDDFSWEVGEDYDIRITTDRGNVFTSMNGILHYDTDGWQVETFSLRIFTSGFTWFLRIKVYIGTDPIPGNLIYDKWEWVGSGGHEVIVPNSGDYLVQITKWGQTENHIATIEWPNGDPWAWVFA